MIIASGLSTIYHGKNLRYYINALREAYPYCMESNPQFIQIVLITFAVLLLIQTPIEKGSQSVFMQILPKRKFPLQSDLRFQKSKLLAERMHKFTVYTFTISILYWILYQSQYLHVYLGGKVFDQGLGSTVIQDSKPSDHVYFNGTRNESKILTVNKLQNPNLEIDYFANYPCQPIPLHLDNYYVMKLAYHFYEFGLCSDISQKEIRFSRIHFTSYTYIGFDSEFLLYQLFANWICYNAYS
eukprot:403359821